MIENLKLFSVMDEQTLFIKMMDNILTEDE